MRFAKDGLHGVGNYFAIEAQYSCGDMYVHKEANGAHGVFQAKVLIGESSKRVDVNRKMPPIKQGNVRYDSVTDNNKMYVVYNN